jgi:hypothetical protein
MIDGGRGCTAYASAAAWRERFELTNPDATVPQSGAHGLTNEGELTVGLSCELFVLEFSE